MAETNLILDPDYRYNLSEIIRVIDGDTVEAVISRDVGFYLTLTWTIRIRVLGVNCPETKGSTKEAGLKATEFTKQWLAQEPCIVETIAKEPHRGTGKISFERWIAKITRADGTSLGDALIEARHAVKMAG